MYIDAHTHHISSHENDSVFELISFYKEQEFKDSYFSIGIHPWYLDEISFERVKELASESRCLAIGETGIDRFHDKKFDKQIELFHNHIQLSQQLQKPLVIHAVKSYSDILASIKQFNYDCTFMLHDFNGNQQIVEQFLKHDVFFSMGDKLFNKSSSGYKILKKIPIDRLLLETDDSSYSIRDVYKKASSLLEIDLPNLQSQLIRNMNSFLRKNLISN